MTSALDKYVSAMVRLEYIEYYFQVLFVGFQAFLCGYSLILFRETQPSLRKGRGKYIGISILISILYTLSTVGDSYHLFMIMKQKDSRAVLVQVYQSSFTWWSIMAGACTSTVSVIGDGLLVYRCYIVCKENPIAWIVTVIVWVASTALSTCLNILYATTGSDLKAYKIFNAWTFSSVGVNCLVTGFISYKLIQVRHQVLKHAPLSHSGISLGVVAILVESAVPSAAFGIVAAGIGIASDRTEATRTVGSLFRALWLFFNAFSPQLITFRVSLGRSWQQEGPQSSFLRSSAFNLEFSHAPDTVRRQSHEGSTEQLPVDEVAVERGLRDM